MRLYYSEAQREKGYFVGACLSLYDHQRFFEKPKTVRHKNTIRKKESIKKNEACAANAPICSFLIFLINLLKYR